MGVTPELVWQCRDRVLRIGSRPLVMGILNTTPDSFSDGGRYSGPDAAVRRGLEMAGEGADIIDVGGESTRPGAEPVCAAEEIERVIPVIRGLADAFAGGSGVPIISVDTRKAEVADQAVKAGARVINDVTALESDRAMAGVARATGTGVVLMHMRGEPGTMQRDPQYGDVVAEVAAYLMGRVNDLKKAGLDETAMAIDPGIGFGKTADHNVRLIAGLKSLARLGRPVVLGVSRKNFIGKITGREVRDRLAGSLACAAWASAHGTHVWRVHDVKESVDAARMVASLNKETMEWDG